jgi:AraC-like DNA-binding protein
MKLSASAHSRTGAAAHAAAPDHSAQIRVSAVLLGALLDVLQQRGVAAEALLGCSFEALPGGPADQSLSIAGFQALLARAIELTGEPALGLSCGLHARDASFGLMAPLASYAPTLRHALAVVTQFQPLVMDGARMQLSEFPSSARLRIDLASGGALARSFVELIVAGLVRMLRAFGCTRTDIHAVCFEHPHPAHYHAYAHAFCGAERFSQRFTGVEFASDVLDRPHLHRQAELHALMLTQAERSLQRLSRPRTCAERVHALLSNREPAKFPDMKQAARELGVSVRSLRRRLEEEGTSYRQLTQVLLHEAACCMLRNPNQTLQSVAYALGFSDPTAFHRAFQRWSKLTPAAYRAQFFEQQALE